MEEKNRQEAMRELNIEEMNTVTGGEEYFYEDNYYNTRKVTCKNCKSTDFEWVSFEEVLNAYEFQWTYRCKNCGNIERVRIQKSC